MMIFQTFSFAQIWSPGWMAITLIIAAAYVYLFIWKRTWFEGAKPVSSGQQLSFYLGILLFYLAVGGPIDLLGHFLFFMHMTKMAILYMIVPPLLIRGIPKWFYLYCSRGRSIVRILRFLSRPILANVVFAGLFSFYHMPYLFDLSMTEALVKAIYTTVLFSMAILVWWPVMTPIPSHQDLSEFRKLAYLYLGAFLLAPSCALIVFASQPLYATYTEPQTWATALGLCISGDPSVILQTLGGPQFLGSVSPLEDQRIGGVLMKVTQEIVYGAALTYTFYRWARVEKLKEPEGIIESPFGG